MTDSPIEDYLDDLLRHTRADARATRRLLDEASDHLFTTAAELEAAGMLRADAEREAVRRFGPADPLVRAAWRRSFLALVLETLRAAILLGGCGLVAVGLSGALAAAMNVAFGRAFVGGATVFGMGGHAVAEAADDAVVLRGFAGVVGIAVVVAYAVLRRRIRQAQLLPAGLVDALGAAAFAAGALVLTVATIDQARQGHGAHGVGFFLSGAIVALAGALLFCVRASKALVGSRATHRRVGPRLPHFRRRPA